MSDPVIIGRATLYLGDCVAVMRGLPDESVDMILTDPPYGHGNHDGDLNARLNDHREIESRPIANDDPESFRTVMEAMLTEAARVLKRDCCCCCCCCCCGGPRPTFAWVANRMDRRHVRMQRGPGPSGDNKTSTRGVRQVSHSYETTDSQIGLLCSYIADDQTIANYYGIHRSRVQQVRSAFRESIPRWLHRSPCEGHNASDGTNSHLIAADQAEHGSRKLNEAYQALFRKWEKMHGFRPGAAQILLPAGWRERS